jgi:hypothetical protein
VEAGEEVAVHPGDRLIVPTGLRLRFEPGRRVPDAPDSGPAWVEPPTPRPGGLGLVALGLTGLLGVVGLPAPPAPPAPRSRGSVPQRRGAQLAVGLVMMGVALAVGWGLYAAWLTPEVYLGGVAGSEVYALPASLPALGEWGGLLAWLALGGLALGAAASALAGLRALPGVEDAAPARGWARRAALVPVVGAGLLASLVPAEPWPVLVLALGVAASALAPAAVGARWSERATSPGIAGGAAVGLLAFLAVALGALASPGEAAAGWRAAVIAAPATIAVPAHLVVAWLLRARRAQPLRLSADHDPDPLPAPRAAGRHAG